MKIQIVSSKVKSKRLKNNKPPIAEMRSQSEVMSYRFSHLLERITKEMKLSQEDAEELFDDMLKFLYICGTNATTKRYSPPPKIDEAWHTFILFTREYAKFCTEYFGYFLHHNPFTQEHRIIAVKKVTPIRPVALKIFGALSKNWKAGSIKAICDCDGNCGCP